VLLGEHGVALAEGAVAAAGIIFADNVAGLGDSHAVLLELSDTSFTVVHSGTFQAVFVSLAGGVHSIDWFTPAWVAHWTIANDQAVAAIGPVLFLVKRGIEVFHHGNKLVVSLGTLSNARILENVTLDGGA